MQINDLPAAVLALCLGKLDDPRDLARASCCCKLWKDHADCSPSWRHFCAQWMHWTAGRYDALQAAGNWRAAYRQRLETGKQAVAALQQLVFPLRRYAALQTLIRLGDDAKDAIEADMSAGGSANIGKQYWSSEADRRCRAAWSAAQLQALLQHGGDSAGVLQGALILAAAFGTPDSSPPVAERVDALAGELRRRMAATGAGNDLQGLRLLCGLLFGQRPGGFCADDVLPPPGAGLQLSGNRTAYYDPDNSLLPRVFQTGKGIPISLSLVAVAVARRAGLQLEYVGSAGHFLTRLVPVASETGGAEHFLDAFSGTVMHMQETRRFLASMGVPLGAQHLEDAVSPANVLHRMLNNLLQVYFERQDLTGLRASLELMCAVDCSPGNSRRLAEVCLALDDWPACIDALTNIGSGAAAAHPSFAPLLREATHMQEACEAEAAAPCLRSREPVVQHRIGQVIEHRRYGYRGLVLAWDPKCEASEQWIQTMDVDALPGGRQQPFFHVRVDSRFRPGQTTYVAQENIKVIMRLEGEDDASFLVQHDEIGKHFDGIEAGGSCYIPNAYLRSVYPED